MCQEDVDSYIFVRIDRYGAIIEESQCTPQYILSARS